MLKNLLFSLILISSGSFAYAQDFVPPKQTIVGAEKPVPLGELVSLSPSVPDKVSNLDKIAYSWRIYELVYDEKTKKISEVEKNGFRQDGNGGVFFGAGIKNKNLKVVLRCTYIFAVHEKVGDKDTITKVEVKVIDLLSDLILGEDVPPEPPSPPEPPKPVGPPVDNTEKFSAAVPAWENATKVADKDVRLKGSLALSNSYSSVAARIAAGTLKTDKVILAELADSNRKALDDNKVPKELWESWAKVMSDFTFNLYDANKLSTDADYAQLFREIARGLSYVK